MQGRSGANPSSPAMRREKEYDVRKFKLLGLAAVAVLALSALIGVSAASATTVCKSAPDTMGNCPTGSALAVNSSLFGDLTFNTTPAGAAETAVLTGFNGSVTVTCSTSTEDGAATEGSWVTGTLGTNGGATATGTFTPAFHNCKDSNNNSCTVSNTGAPYNATVTTTNATTTTGPNGTLNVVINSGSGQHVNVTCGFVTCQYSTGAGGVNANTYNPGNGARPDRNAGSEDSTGAQAYFNGVALTSGCGNGTWTANYELFSGTAPPPETNEVDLWLAN